MKWRCMLCSQTNTPHRRRDICIDCADGLAVRSLAWCSKGRHRVSAAVVRRSWCNACRNANQRARRDPAAEAARVKAWRTENQEHIAAYDAARREHRRETSRAYYAAHKERLKARNRQYYRANRSRIIQQKQAWHAANPTYYADYSRRWRARQKLRTLQTWRRAA
jgi:hypothetical protein